MKIATAQIILRNMYEKRAGIIAPVVLGASVAAAAHGTSKAIDKSRDYHAGFNPNYVPRGHQ